MIIKKPKLKFSIKQDFQKNFIEKTLNKIGWNSIDCEFKIINYQEVINEKILKESIFRINKNVSLEVVKKTIKKLKTISLVSLEERNEKITEYICEQIQIYDNDLKKTINVKLIEEKNVELNNFQLIRQFKVSDRKANRRPDIVLYINGLPVIVMELKSEVSNENIRDAYEQIEYYKENIPKLFEFNFFNVITNRWMFKYGSITSKFNNYFKWFEFENFENKEKLKFEEKIKIFFDKKRIIDMIFKYSFWDNEGKKYIAAQHQIRAAKKTMKRLEEIENDSSEKNKGGIIWHTQGSGKTITMLLLSKEIFKKYKNSTIILITDRKQLNNQITERFLKSHKFLWVQNIFEINSWDKLKKELEEIKCFKIFSSTIQKFKEKTGLLSKRSDIFFLIDEVHRTQNLEIVYKVDKNNKKITEKKGYAKYLRLAFPNAKFIGFTGTPIMSEKKDTRKEFGPCNDEYYMFEAEKDGFIVPINYENKKINLNTKIISKTKENSILENESVIEEKVKDILIHWEKRKKILNGKSMIIVKNRETAVIYYKKICKLKPKLKERVILVMTKNIKKDSEEMKNLIVSNKILKKVTNDFKNTTKYYFVIVVNKWLTGFDCQDLDTIYLNKFIKQEHNLMQTISRVNRTFETEEKIKKNGLIVDYVNILPLLKKAMIFYNKKINDFEIPVFFRNIKEARKKLNDCLKKINDFYINNLFKINDLTKKEEYEFKKDSVKKLIDLNNEKKINFLTLNEVLQELYKNSHKILEKNEIKCSNFVESIKKILLLLLNYKKINFSKNEGLKMIMNDIVDFEKIKVTSIEIETKIKNISLVLAKEEIEKCSDELKETSKILNEKEENNEFTKTILRYENNNKTKNIEIKTYKLKNVFEIKAGKAKYNKNYIKNNSGIYSVYSQKVSNNGVYGKINTYDFNGEYLIMARFGNFASNVVYINDKFSCNGSVFCFKLKKEYKKLINLKYVFELLKKNYKKIKKLNVDTNNKSITKAKIGEIEFEIPIN